MAEWVSHLIIADRLLKQFPGLCRREFCAGSIAPDCNIENGDWTVFTPPREVTHWMSEKRKTAADCDRFMHEYIEKRVTASAKEESFLLGYYAHLVTDAEFQRFIRDEERIKAVWKRIRANSELRQLSAGMEENWDSVKQLINGRERMKDIHTVEREYLDGHPDSGFFTEILGLEEFPDYIAYLPHGAIPRKIRVMGRIPQKEESVYPFLCISREEYSSFTDSATALTADGIRLYGKQAIH